MLKIHESGMWFHLSEDKTFPIEKSDTYRKVNTRSVSTVEFITMGPKQDIIFVEAKTNAPDTENGEGIGEFVERIGKKFVHSLEVCYALLTKALPDAEPSFPDLLQAALKRRPAIKLILIVNRLSRAHCVTLQDALRLQLRAEMRIWQMNVIVLNKEIALKKNLIKG
ncbi:hypothetical protein [Mitsuokella multacida]